MYDTVAKTTRIICALQSSCNGRVSIRSIQDRCEMSRSSVYRYLVAIARELPVRVDNGIVSLAEDESASVI